MINVTAEYFFGHYLEIQKNMNIGDVFYLKRSRSKHGQIRKARKKIKKNIRNEHQHACWTLWVVVVCWGYCLWKIPKQHKSYCTWPRKFSKFLKKIRNMWKEKKTKFVFLFWMQMNVSKSSKNIQNDQDEICVHILNAHIVITTMANLV